MGCLSCIIECGASYITQRWVQSISIKSKLRKKGSFLFMTEPIEMTVGRLLRQKRLKLAIAESCTGGLVCDRITNIPGSSEYFMGGIVAYAYEAKAKLLGVGWDTLTAHGAVSRQVVLEMARGARLALETDLAVSVSGIAGPGGVTDEKPVGTTWIGLSALDGEWARGFCWQGDRIENKAASAEAVLQILADYLNGWRELNGDLK
jgi:PncC family amidohydrolase